MNLHNMEYTPENIKKIGYITICAVLVEVVVAGKRIAYAKELKSIKTLVNPLNTDKDEDLELLRILKEPHVKLASELADFIDAEILNPYALLNALDDHMVLEDEWAAVTGTNLFWKFMFYRSNPRVRDRYVNFSSVLLTAQRVIFETLKLMTEGKTRAFEHGYRTNYSPGRLNALMLVNEERSAKLLWRLVNKLKEYEEKSRAITVIFKKNQ